MFCFGCCAADLIPTDWNRVNAIFQVFCELAGTDPDGARWEDPEDPDEEVSKRDRLHQLWDQALEEDPAYPAPSRPADDPWAAEPDAAPF